MTSRRARRQGTTRRQCAKCPWKVDTDPYEIPDGYCSIKHRGLKGTIAEPGSLVALGGPMRIMACHESTVGRELPCVGWLDNQLGVGNNLPLRLAAALGHVDTDYELVGEQHKTFKDTLPEDA